MVSREGHNVSYHLPLGCLCNSFCRLPTMKISKSALATLCEGNHRWPLDPHTKDINAGGISILWRHRIDVNRCWNSGSYKHGKSFNTFICRKHWDAGMKILIWANFAVTVLVHRVGFCGADMTSARGDVMTWNISYITDFCVENKPDTGQFPAQSVSGVELY